MHAIQDHPAADYSHLRLRVLQFGEGNFLRAFADWMIDKANEAGAFAGSIAVVKPRPGSLAAFRAQGNRYTVVARGLREGRAVREARLVTSIAQTVDPYEDFSAFLRLARCDTLELVLSNTTEAGLALSPDDRPDAAPPASFPAKLTRLLFERYRHFQGAADKGLYCLPLSCCRKTAGSWRPACNPSSAAGRCPRRSPPGCGTAAASATPWWIGSCPASRRTRRPPCGSGSDTPTSF